MKKNAIRFLIVAFAFAALSLPALAQGGPAGAGGEGQGPHHGMPSVDERVQHLTKMLNLSGDQQTKIKSILQDEHNQMTSLKQDTSLSQEDQHAKFQQIRQASAEKIRGALNDEQKAKFDQMQAEHKGHMGKRGGHGDTGSSDKQ
jgi:Spy/CpxP family protein refolding chaperone